MKKVFVDANIIIDLFDTKRVTKYDNRIINLHKQAIKLFTYLERKNIEVFISEDIISNVAYHFRKNKPCMKNFISFLDDIKNSTSYNFLAFGSKVIDQATQTYLRDDNIDFEDTLQYFCAFENNCDTIYTNDKNFPNLEINIKNTYDL